MCTSADEAELRVCLAGLYIDITFHKPIILETGCSFMVSFLTNKNLERSHLVDLKSKALSISILLRNFKLKKFNRRANEVAQWIPKFSFDNRLEGILCTRFPS